MKSGGGCAALWPLLLTTACSAPPVARDRDRYLAVLADPELEPSVGLGACAEISDDDLRGDCGLAVVSAEARRRGGAPERWCGEVEAGPWRDECYFVAAEAHRKRGREQSAAWLCGQAGRFVDDCGQHLWQTAVYSLVHNNGPDGISAALPRARQLYARWLPLLGETTDFKVRFWERYYQNGFEGLGTLDLRWCDRLDLEEDRSRCVAAAVKLYDRELGPGIQRGRVNLCAQSLTSGELQDWVHAVPDPRFDAAVDRRRVELCGGDTTPPPPAPPP